MKQYVLGWISVLNTIKHIDMKDYFAEFLDGVFKMLGDNNKDIQRSAENILGEFLHQIITDNNNNKPLKDSKKKDYSVIFKIVVEYCNAKGTKIQNNTEFSCRSCLCSSCRLV